MNWSGLNAGDDFLFRAVLEAVEAQDVDSELALMSHTYGPTVHTAVDPRRWVPVFDAPKNIRHLLRAARLLAASDAVIVGGGDVIRPQTHALLPLLLSATLGKPLFLAGVGAVGPQGVIQRLAYHAALRSVRYAYVRDAWSMNLLDGFLRRTCKRVVAPDPVFGACLDVSLAAEGTEAKVADGAERHSAVAVNLASLTERQYTSVVLGDRPYRSEDFVRWLADQIREIGRRTGAEKVILVPMVDQEAVEVTGDPTTSDHLMLGRLRDCIESSMACELIAHRPRHLEDLGAIFSRSRVVVGMRYHFLIPALAWGLPTLALQYAPKVRALSEWVPEMASVDLGTYLTPGDRDARRLTNVAFSITSDEATRTALMGRSRSALADVVGTARLSRATESRRLAGALDRGSALLCLVALLGVSTARRLLRGSGGSPPLAKAASGSETA